MVRTIKPIGNKVLCYQVMPALKTNGGLVLLEKYEDDRKRFRVLACGPGKRLKDGTLAPIEASPGDIVLTEMMGRDRAQLEDGTGRWVIDATEIVAVLKEENGHTQESS